MRRIIAPLAVLVTFLAPPVGAQLAAGGSVAAHLAQGDSLSAALEPGLALEAYRQAFFADPTSYAAIWKFAEAQIQVATLLEGDRDRDTRDSLFWVASLYADKAARTRPDDPEGHFMVAQALGRLSRERGGKERVRFGKEIYDAAARALELNPNHDGAHHVLGAWHAEVRRLSGIARFFAKTFLGGGYLDRASWDSAVVHLERAVELRPEYIYHRLELAEVYLDLERYADAVQQLSAIQDLPPTSDVADPHYKRRAARLLEETRNKAGA